MKDFSHHKIVAHMASWCPDCTREMVKLKTFLESLGDHSPEFQMILNYENKEEYKKLKSEHKLPILALPTVYFYDQHGELIDTLVEVSDKPIIDYIKGN